MNKKSTNSGTKNAQRKDEFARLVFGGMSKAEAYRKAYCKPDMSPDAARRAANRLSHDDYVCEKLQELEANADFSAVLSKHARMVMLSEMAEKCSESNDVRGMVACIAELNKMDGAYEPAKLEVQGDIVRDFVRAQIEKASAEPLVKR